jgi:alpha 1,3-glucosidase
MLDKLVSHGRKLVTIIDPHTKVEDGYWMHNDTRSNGLNVKSSDPSKDFESECWPKESTWLDFLNSDTRDYIKSLYTKVPEQSADPLNYIWTDDSVLVWNDMNEPACFNQTEATIPKSCMHTFKNDSSREPLMVEHRAVHNVYGFFNSMATSQALLERSNNQKRVFHLSRSFFVGTQRHYAAVWTADCRCDWDHFRLTVQQMLATSIVGLPLVGSDVPGFYRDPCDD